MIFSAVGVVVFFGIIVFLVHLFLSATLDKKREKEAQQFLEDQEHS